MKTKVLAKMGEIPQECMTQMVHIQESPMPAKGHTPNQL